MNNNIDNNKQDDKKRKKKFFIYFINILIVFLVLTLLFLIGQIIYNYYSSVAMSDKNMVTALDSYGDFTCDEKTNTVSANYTENKLKDYKAKDGEVIGHLEIPEIDGSKRAITYDPSKSDGLKALKVGVALDGSSKMPGTNDTTVIAGHNDYMFKFLEDAKDGQSIILNVNGEVFTYKIYKTDIINYTEVNKVFLSDEDTLVLYSCYPFSFLPNQGQRFVVYAKEVPSVQYDKCDTTN